MITYGGGASATTLAAPLESRTPPEIPPLFMHRLSIAKPHSFNDCSSYLLLFAPFVATVLVSNLAKAAAYTFSKSLVALPSTRLA